MDISRDETLTQVASLVSRAIILAFVLSISGASLGERTSSVIEDENYRFRLVPPGPEWALMTEREIQRLSPDSIAGLRRRDDFYASVLVERSLDFSLDEHMALLLESMPLESKRIESERRDMFLGYPSLLKVVGGELNDVPFRYFIRMTQRGNWIYQLVGLELASKEASDFSAFKAVEQSFSFTEGAIDPRDKPVDIRVTTGVGWRLNSGRFESAAYGFAVQSPQGWRLVVGDELRSMAGDAEIGLARSNPDAYLTVVPERLIGTNRQELMREFVAQSAAELGAPIAQETLDLDFGGVSLSMRALSPTKELPIEILVGILWHGDVAFKVKAWYPQDVREKGRGALQEALSAFEFLSSREHEQLARLLATLPDTQNVIGKGFSLRQGSYRDFEQGFVWRKPDGFWRVTVGQDVRAINEDATLLIENPVLGIYGLVIVEEVGDTSLAVYHDAVLENVGSAKHKAVGAPRMDVMVGAVSSMQSQGKFGKGNSERAFTLTTLKIHDRALQILILGRPGNMERAREASSAFLRGFKFLEPGYKVQRSELGGWTDERIGFRLRSPGDDWVFKDETPEILEPVGTTVSWSTQSDTLRLVAICNLTEEQDPRAILDPVISELERQVSKDRTLTLKRDEIVFKGYTAERIISHPTRTIEIVLFSRARTVFALISSSSHGRTDLSLKEIERLFAFLD